MSSESEKWASCLLPSKLALMAFEGSHHTGPRGRPTPQKIAPISCTSNLKRTKGKSYYNSVEGFWCWFSIIDPLGEAFCGNMCQCFCEYKEQKCVWILEKQKSRMRSKICYLDCLTAILIRAISIHRWLYWQEEQLPLTPLSLQSWCCCFENFLIADWDIWSTWCFNAYFFTTSVYLLALLSPKTVSQVSEWPWVWL